MTVILKIFAVAVIGLIIVSLIRIYKPEFTVEAVLCTSLLLLWFALDGLKLAFTYMENLYGKLTYGKEYFPVIIKVLIIAYVTEFTSALCEDAGEKSIGTKIELAGKIGIFFVAVPVFKSLLDLLESLI